VKAALPGAIRLLLPPDTPGDSGAPKRDAPIIIVTVCLCLTIHRYTGSIGSLGEGRLGELAWWATSCVFWYAIVPILVWKLLIGRSTSEIGLRLGLSLKHARIYLLMALVMAPVVYLVSMSPRFLSQYPFLRPVDGAIALDDLLAWEAMYAAQFVALELLFRGFLTLGLARRFGGGAVWIMVIPYCMLHFGKPMLETLASIAAGIALGSMALRTRSILPGAALHIAVAWSMDALALAQQGATLD